MGLYDSIVLEAGVDLPEFEGDREAVDWQTKSIGMPFMQTFKLTSDGRLLRKEQSVRDLTAEELDAKAREQGYDSWADWEAADTFSPLPSWKRAVDEEWWVDHHQHGSFEFHGHTDETRYSYEARFTKGELDEILLLDSSKREPTAQS